MQQPLAESRYALGFVADALEISEHLHDREDQTQVRCCRLAPGEDERTLLVDGQFRRVDALLAVAYLAQRGGFARDQHTYCRGDLLLDDAAHRQYLAANVLDLAVELA